MSPLTGKSEYTLANSAHFVSTVSNETILDNEIMVSFDVESLFTNVLIDATVQAALQKLENDPSFADSTTPTPAQIADLLTFALRSTYFQYFEEQPITTLSYEPVVDLIAWRRLAVCIRNVAIYITRDFIVRQTKNLGLMEWWMFLVNGDWSSCRPSRQETVRYYHAMKKCLTNRLSFFLLTTWKFLMMLKITFEIHTRSISQASLSWHPNKTWDYVPVCERTFSVLVPHLPYNSFKLSVVKSWAKAA